MAVATWASGPALTIVGNRRMVHGKVTAPADTDTIDTGLVSVYSAQVSFAGSTKPAAADAVGVTAVSGGVLTIGVTGTARDLFIWAIGV